MKFEKEKLLLIFSGPSIVARSQLLISATATKGHGGMHKQHENARKYHESRNYHKW